MQKVRVVSKKYDGSLRDEYETYLYAETDETIVLFSLPGLSYWDYRKEARFQTQDGLIEIYFKRRWYNVWHIAEQVRNAELIYINISQPAFLNGGTLEWVDLDLDYRVYMDSSVELLDEEEFLDNARRYNYPPGLVAHARAACREVETGLAGKVFPFDHERQAGLYARIKAGLRSE